jgi:hypothetical protein
MPKKSKSRSGKRIAALVHTVGDVGNTRAISLLPMTLVDKPRRGHYELAKAWVMKRCTCRYTGFISVHYKFTAQGIEAYSAEPLGQDKQA